MTDSAESPAVDVLSPLIGKWLLVASFGEEVQTDPEAWVVFDWLPGGHFLTQRWQVPMPEAPDGLAIIGADPARPGQFLQHYFDSRGVARVYKMTFDGTVLTLWRDEPDLSPLDFEQRYVGRLASDGSRISGAWQSRYPGKDWEHDFGLDYARV
jgi:hypothetical protein